MIACRFGVLHVHSSTCVPGWFVYFDLCLDNFDVVVNHHCLCGMFLSDIIILHIDYVVCFVFIHCLFMGCMLAVVRSILIQPIVE